VSFDYNGGGYLTGLNTTYSVFKIPEGCNVTPYKMDIRCRYYYAPTMASPSIKSYPPEIFYSSLGVPFLATIFCKRTPLLDSNGDLIVHSITCISIDLTKMSMFMSNFEENSKF